MNDIIKQSDENKKMMAMNLMGGLGSFGLKIINEKSIGLF